MLPCLGVGAVLLLALGCGGAEKKESTPDAGNATAADASTDPPDAGSQPPDAGRVEPDAAPVGCSGNPECDDGNACNGVETCDLRAGLCVAGNPLECDDGDDCNGVETCDGEAGCVDGEPLVCTDPFACTANTCVDGECTTQPNDELCDDNLACNGAEQCTAGQGCVDGQPLDCGVTDNCAIRGCSEDAGGSCTAETIVHDVTLTTAQGQFPFDLACGQGSAPETSVCFVTGAGLGIFECRINSNGRLRVVVTNVQACAEGMGPGVLTGCSNFVVAGATIASCCF